MPADPVIAKLKFLANLDEPLVYIPSKGGGDETDHVGNFTMQEVSVYNGRLHLPSSSLDVEGFLLELQPTAVDDFYDDNQVQTTYHQEVRTLLMETTGAARVEIFDDTRRSSSLKKQRAKTIREPANIVHNDYTARSGVKRLRDHFVDRPNEAIELLRKRFAVINVWRSIAGTILDHPLVLCDSTTVKSDDLVSVERRAEERVGELQVALYDAAQRWYYFPEMRMDEVLLFKTFDSETDGRTQFTIHSSFKDPSASDNAPPRESIETRCLVFFE
ncbi:MAG: CmcJ/NvfI family oxidoreductase [Woeseiaceae bacterium]